MKKLDGLRIAKEIAHSKGGSCLSASYINIREHMEWKCASNHTWRAQLNQIRNQKHWCPHCAKKAPLKYAYIKSEIEKRNGILLSDEYIGIFKKLKIRCHCKNIFYMGFNSIKYGRWCPKCGEIKKADKRRHPYAYIEKQIYDNGGQLLTKEYKNRSQKLSIKCNCGHIFSATFRNIHNGHWCPGCALNKSQRKLQSIVEEIVRKKCIFNYRGFGWLKNPQTNRRLEVDIWVPELKLAIEYDGIQHFKPTRFGGSTERIARKRLIYQKNIDSIKDELIREHKEDIKFFIRIPYTEKLELINIKNILHEVKGEVMLINCTTKGCLKTSNALLNAESLEVVCQECGGSIDNISEAMKRTLKSFGQVIKGNKRAFMLACTACRANREVVMDQNNKTVCKTCHTPITIHAAFKMAMEEAGGLERVDTTSKTKKKTKKK